MQEESWQYCPAAHPLVEGLAAFSDNYVWMIHAARGPAVAVVDPGDAAPVLVALEAQGLSLAAIVLTHHHPDHIGGVAELVRRTGCLVIGPRDERIPGVDRRCGEGDTVALPGLDLTLRCLEVPGHTMGHVAWFAGRHGEDPRPLLFSGDTLFAAGCGRLFEGSPAEMHDSLSRLAALPPATLVYCAHEYTLSNLRFAAAVEPDSAELAARQAEAVRRREAGLPTVPSTLAIERATNPFLRAAVPAAREAAAARLGQAPSDPVEVFAALRQWKDQFR